MVKYRRYISHKLWKKSSCESHAFLFALYCILVFFLCLTVADCIERGDQNSYASTSRTKEKEDEIPQLRNRFQEVSGLRIETKQGCVMMDDICIAPHEVASYEAIKSIHAHLDDDHSGDIDLSESVDFLREELNYTKGAEKRQKAFHHNNDHHISVQELWSIWLSNEVHNWTVEQTVGWLHVSVELGQYAEVFYENAINGSVLPRLATNTEQYLTRILGIKSPTHRSKFSIKAMDIVLFGPPKETGSIIKDVFIAALILVIMVLLFKFNRMSQSNNAVVKKMEQEMESLQEEMLRFNEIKNAPDEDAEKRGSKQLTKDDIFGEKDHEFLSSEARWEVDSEFPDFDEMSVSEYPELEVNSRNELQLWLQLSYEKERIDLESKIHDMKKQLEEAREMCDKMKPSRKNLFGAFSFIHGRMEFKGQPVMEARSAFAEIQAMDKEMDYRWSAMERILCVPIIHNLGIDHLQFILEPTLQNSMTHSVNSTAGLTNPPSERGLDSPTSTISRQSTSENVVRRQRRDHHLRSTRNDFMMNQGSSTAVASTLGSLASSRSSRMSGFQPHIPHSHTVGSGLSTYAEDSKSRTFINESRSESKMKERNFRLSNVPRNKNGNNYGVNGAYSSSNDDTDSGNFTVGDSEIRTRPQSNFVLNRETSTTPSETPPMSQSLESCKDGQEQRAATLSNKVRERRKRLNLMIKSFSQEYSMEEEIGLQEVRDIK